MLPYRKQKASKHTGYFGDRCAMAAFSTTAACAELFFLAAQCPAFRAHGITTFIVCQMGCEVYTAHNRIMHVVYCLKNNPSFILCTLLTGFPFIQIRKPNFSFVIPVVGICFHLYKWYCIQAHITTVLRVNQVFLHEWKHKECIIIWNYTY